MTTIDTRYAVYVADQCMAKFVHAPDASHYRQQLIRRIRDEAPDLPAVQIATVVSVRDQGASTAMSPRVWLLWDCHQLISLHANVGDAEVARRDRLERHYVDHLAGRNAEDAVTITMERIDGIPGVETSRGS